MASRTLAFATLILLAACETTNPVQVAPSFTTSPALAAVNPADIAVLAVEDGTPDGRAGKLLTLMRQVLMRALTERMYSPLSPAQVDAALSGDARQPSESSVTPAYLKRVAGRATEDATLAVRIDDWDESTLLTDKVVRFRVHAVLVAANTADPLWSGTMQGEVKAGGLGAAPRDKDGMARSCAELAMSELLNHLRPRTP
jgi:hypothetical protein